jgi:hypothetical protein
MPFVEKRLINPTSLTTSASTALYTVPTGYTAIVKQIVVTNTTGTAATFTMYIGAASAGNALFSGTSVAANDTVIINLSQVLGTGEILRALSGTNAALNLTVSGVENDGPLAQNTMYIADNAVTVNKIADGSVTNAKIADGAIIDIDVNASAAIAQSKIANLTSDLALKAPLASPTFTGTPAAPTAVAATSTTQIATTAFVTTADNLKANIASPTLTGVPLAPTAAAGTNTTQIATMASKPWNTAWGMQTYTTATANDLTITSEELQITGSSFTAITGRLYKITYYEPELYGSTSYMQVNVRYTNASGTIRQLHYVQLNGNNNVPSVLIWIGQLTAGATNFVATLRSHAGTGAAYRAADQVAYLAVEDIGPA